MRSNSQPVTWASHWFRTGMGPSESASPRRRPATSSDRTERCRRLSSAPPCPSAPPVLHWDTSPEDARVPTGALCVREHITPTSTGPNASTALMRVTSLRTALILPYAPCVAVDIVPMMLRASRGGSTPHPRMPGRPHPCRGALTLAGEAFPSKRLAPNLRVRPELPLVREGGPLQGSPSPLLPALERPTPKSHPTLASLTSLCPWTCQRPVTNESPKSPGTNLLVS